MQLCKSVLATKVFVRRINCCPSSSLRLHSQDNSAACPPPSCAQGYVAIQATAPGDDCCDYLCQPCTWVHRQITQSDWAILLCSAVISFLHIRIISLYTASKYMLVYCTDSTWKIFMSFFTFRLLIYFIYLLNSRTLRTMRMLLTTVLYNFWWAVFLYKNI